MGSTFRETGIVNIKFESLQSVAQSQFMSYCFADCANLQNIYFYALDTSSFGSYTNIFINMLSGDSNVTVHFPIRIQSKISSWADVVNGFGGTGTTVLFDIVTTITDADNNTYSRQEKDSTNTSTAWALNNVLYYTNGVTEPVIGDTIYSDAACTTAVTTIGSIA